MKNIIRMSLVAGALVTSVAAQAQTAWTDKVTLGGDLRLRTDRIFDEDPTATRTITRTRQQVRARLTASAKVNEAMTANFRLSTDPAGADTRRSANHTFDGAGADSAVAFELAYGDWRVMPGLVLSLGKAPNPFWQAGKNEMLWDADLAFDGTTAKWAADMDMFKPFLNLSYNWIDEQRGTGNTAPAAANVMQVGAQAGASMGLGDAMRGTLAVGYHAFNNMPQNGLGLGVAGMDYWLLNVGAEVGIDMVANLPLAVFGDWVQNQGSRQDSEKTGWLAGVRAGQLNNVGSWEAWYNYRDVGAHAVIGQLADSEFAGGDGVDVNGHQIGAGYMAWDNTTIGVNYFETHRANGAATGGDYDRVMADLVWKF